MKSLALVLLGLLLASGIDGQEEEIQRCYHRINDYPAGSLECEHADDKCYTLNANEMIVAGCSSDPMLMEWWKSIPTKTLWEELDHLQENSCEFISIGGDEYRICTNDGHPPGPEPMVQLQCKTKEGQPPATCENPAEKACMYFLVVGQDDTFVGGCSMNEEFQNKARDLVISTVFDEFAGVEESENCTYIDEDSPIRLCKCSGEDDCNEEDTLRNSMCLTRYKNEPQQEGDVYCKSRNVDCVFAEVPIDNETSIIVQGCMDDMDIVEYLESLPINDDTTVWDEVMDLDNNNCDMVEVVQQNEEEALDVKICLCNSDNCNDGEQDMVGDDDSGARALSALLLPLTLALLSFLY